MRVAKRARRAPAGRGLVTALLLSVLSGGVTAFTMSAEPAGRDSAEALLAAHRFERVVVDLEASGLGYIATGDEGSLRPWNAAHEAFHRQATALLRLAAENGPEQSRRAREIVHAATSFLHEHAEPFVRTARRDRVAARSTVTRAEGKRRIDAIRRQFDRFEDGQHRLVMAHERDAGPALRRVAAATAAVSSTFLLVFLLGGLVMRSRGPGPRILLARPGLGRFRPATGEPEALQRVATLAAAGGSPAEVVGAAAREMGRVLHAEHAMVCRFEDGTVVVTGHWSVPGAHAVMPPVGGRWRAEEDDVAAAVQRTGRPAFPGADTRATGEIGAWLEASEIRRYAGCPIMAGERLWGMAAVLSHASRPWPARAERTARDFAGLVGIAVANARRRAELAASRVRLVEASDATRRRIERTLHETTQQRLATVGLELRATEAAVPPEMEWLRDQVSCAARDVAEIMRGLQDVARQLHPAILIKGGLESSLRALARRAPLPVELEVHGEYRLPSNIAVTVYYVMSEALANVALHAHASVVRVGVELREPVRLVVSDDGVGGARPRPGSALACLRDRTEALGGVLEIDSPLGVGTSLRVTIPGEPPVRFHARDSYGPDWPEMS